MNPALMFVIYLLALVVFVVAAAWGLMRRPFTPVHGIALGLALVDVVWVVQSAQAAF